MISSELKKKVPTTFYSKQVIFDYNQKIEKTWICNRMSDQEKGTSNSFRWRNGNQFLAVILGKFPKEKCFLWHGDLLEKLFELHQWIFFVSTANIVVCGHGNLLGWISPTLPTLLSEDTPLKTGPLTNEQVIEICILV